VPAALDRISEKLQNENIYEVGKHENNRKKSVACNVHIREM
jgi:hypothetical protein